MGRRQRHEHASWDVVVVGAGPAGSTCARLLAEAGHRTLLLEKEEDAGACANCTGIIGEEGFRVFDLPRELVVYSISDIDFHGPRARHVGFAAGRDLAHVVRRFAFDRALAERAAAAGAELRLGVQVSGGERKADGWDLRVARGTPGVAETIHARSVVLAVGYNLSLLRAFGVEGPRRFVQGVQLLCANRGVDKVQVLVGSRYAPGSFGWAVPLGPDLVKVGLTSTRKALTHLDHVVNSRTLAGRIDISAARLRSSPIPVGAPSRCHAERLLVVGEAAGQVKTTSNGGIYYSMLGARAAAETLGAALRRDDLSAAALGAYESAWRKTLGAELAVGRELRSVFESMSDTKLATLMWLASGNGLIDHIRERADFDWHGPLIEDLSRHWLIGPFFGGLAKRLRAPA